MEPTKPDIRWFDHAENKRAGRQGGPRAVKQKGQDRMRVTIVTTEEYKGFTIKIEQADNPESPRTRYEHTGIMLCWHPDYGLDDEQVTQEEARERVAAVEKEGGVVLPLYLSDHSGITMSTTLSSDNWDAGQVGYIYAMVDELNFKSRDDLTADLVEEVALYDQYLRDDIWSYEVRWKGIVRGGSSEVYGADQALQDAREDVDMYICPGARRLPLEHPVVGMSPPDTCPACGQGKLIYGDITKNVATATQPVACDRCVYLATFTYTLTVARAEEPKWEE